MKIGFIGCGNMAAHLLYLKQDVTCFDADRNNLDSIVKLGPKQPDTVRDSAQLPMKRQLPMTRCAK